MLLLNKKCIFIFICFALLLNFKPVFSQCVSNNITGDLIITSNTNLSGTYTVSGIFRVDPGVTVTVTPFSVNGCGELIVFADEIEVLGTIDANHSGFSGGEGGLPGGCWAEGNFTDCRGISDCWTKDNCRSLRTVGGFAGAEGMGPGRGLGGDNGNDGLGSKQSCGTFGDNGGRVHGSGGAGGGGGGSYGGVGGDATVGGSGGGASVSNQTSCGGFGGGTAGAGGNQLLPYQLDQSYDINMGSGGGGAGGGGRGRQAGTPGEAGGAGGGLVRLQANSDITVSGTILANGQNGGNGGNGGQPGRSPRCCDDACNGMNEATFTGGGGAGAGSGGGSGGGIMLESLAGTANITGNLQASGGNGGNGGNGGTPAFSDSHNALFCSSTSGSSSVGSSAGNGGGGGGGRIKIFVNPCLNNVITPTLETDGGNGASNGANGSFFQGANPNAVLPLADAGTDATICDGDVTTLSGQGSGGVGVLSYSWSPSTGLSATNIPNPQANPGSTTTYTLTVTDANGCQGTSDVTVFVTNSINDNIIAENQFLCGPGIADTITGLIPTGGTGSYGYQWETSINNGATWSNIGGANSPNLLPGQITQNTWIRRIVTSGPCSSVSNIVEITVSSQLFVDAVNVNDVSCFNGQDGSATVTVSGGAAPFSYNWSSGDTTSIAGGLSVGTYTVTVSDQAGCEVIESLAVSQPDSIMLELVSTDATCNGASDGSIDLTVSGGVQPYSYLWSNFQITQNINQISAGTYVVVVTDANGCQEVAQTTIEESAPLEITADKTDVLCNGENTGSIELTVLNATNPVNYQWSDGNSSSVNSDLSAGSYQVTATDANGCEATASFSIQEPSAIIAEIDGQNLLCFGDQNGWVSVNVQGGNPDVNDGYTYNWSAGVNQTGHIADNLEAGSYSVTITDNNNCEIVKSITLTEPDLIEVSASVTDAACFGENNGSVELAATGGNGAPFTYSLDGIAFTPDTDFSNLNAGIYNGVAKDNKGCTDFVTFEISQPEEIIINTGPDLFISSGETVTPEIAIMPEGIQADSISWSPQQGLSCFDCLIPDFSPGQTTLYTISFWDEDGCYSEASITVFVEQREEYKIYIPNAFSPNSDGTNDIFQVFGYDIELLEMRIFNRWGAEVYTNTNMSLSDGWDGTYNGSEATGGTYVYVANVRFTNGVERTLRGSLVLIR